MEATAFQSLVESIDDVVFQLDTEQRCVNLFGRWLEREGFYPEQFIGRTTRDILGADKAPVHERANLRALAGETVTYEWILSTPRGPRHVLNTLSPLRDAGGVITGVVGVGRDITARIEAEQQVRQAQKMEAVGRFAGGVAHDLNNMMMIIMGFSDFLLGTLDRQDPRWSDADEIRKAAERAMQLTRQLLGFGRHRVVARQVLSLNEVVAGMERMLRPLLGEDMTLVTVWRPTSAAIEADYGQMEQVVMNLTLNARDAMGSGGHAIHRDREHRRCPRAIPTSTSASPYPEAPTSCCVVTDTGHGMTPEVKAHLFEPFFTTKPTTQNTGLGLATVYGIVAQSGGLHLGRERAGTGRELQDLFPAGRHGRLGRRGGRESGAPFGRDGDDSPGGRRRRGSGGRVPGVVRARLSGAGGVERARGPDGRRAGGQRASTWCSPTWSCPRWAGRSWSTHVASILPGARVMYMSGYSESDKLQRGISESDDPFLQKPFSSENLVSSVRHALDRARH